MFITYHVKAGKEEEMIQVLSRAWEIYRRERLVFSEPHVIVQTRQNGKPRFMEIFTWVSHDAPDHAPAEVKAIWKEMHLFCEAREGSSSGIDGGEVGLVSPPMK